MTRLFLQSLQLLHKNESIHEGCGGDTLLQGRLSPPIDYVHRDKRDMRNCAEGHSETTNNQTVLIPFDHYIKMKAYMRVGGGGHFTPG